VYLAYHIVVWTFCRPI